MTSNESLIKMEIDGKELREFVKTLDQYEPGLRKQFTKDLKSGLKPLADSIAAKVPASPPISGFGHRGRTAWSKVTASVYVTPGGGKSGSVARIEVYGRGSQQAALKIADLAGTRNKGDQVNRGYQRSGSSRSRGATIPKHGTFAGDSMIENLQQRFPLWRNRGGRFIWTNFIGQRKKMIDIAIKILDSYADKVNRSGKP
jgi:hypothetical protein